MEDTVWRALFRHPSIRGVAKQLSVLDVIRGMGPPIRRNQANRTWKEFGRPESASPASTPSAVEQDLKTRRKITVANIMIAIDIIIIMIVIVICHYNVIIIIIIINIINVTMIII